MVYRGSRVVASARRGLPAIAIEKQLWTSLLTVRRDISAIAAVWPGLVCISLRYLGETPPHGGELVRISGETIGVAQGPAALR